MPGIACAPANVDDFDTPPEHLDHATSDASTAPLRDELRETIEADVEIKGQLSEARAALGLADAEGARR